MAANFRFLLPMVILFALLGIGCATSASGKGSGESVRPVEDLTRSGYPTASTKEQIDAFSAADTGPYFVGPGDLLRLRSGKNEFPDEELKVSPDGTINVTSVGEIVINKMDVRTVEKAINEKLKKFYTNVECSLVLVSAINKKIALLGAVRTPGVVMLDSDMSLIDVIAKAGGFDSGADNSLNIGRTRLLCRVIRENGMTVWIDLKAILFQNAIGYNVRLKNNDILYVFRQ